MSGGLYVKLQADYSDDPKIIRAGEAAEVLYVRMLCFCARTLSDGLVDDAQMTRLALRQLPKRVARLLEEHLVERVEGGYKIVSWHKHNRSAASIAEERDKKSSGSNHANHLRWHVQMGRFVAECVWCQADRQPPSGPSDKGSDKGSDIGSDTRSLWDSIDPTSDPDLDPDLAPASATPSDSRFIECVQLIAAEMSLLPDIVNPAGWRKWKVRELLGDKPKDGDSEDGRAIGAWFESHPEATAENGKVAYIANRMVGTVNYKRGDPSSNGSKPNPLDAQQQAERKRQAMTPRDHAQRQLEDAERMGDALGVQSARDALAALDGPRLVAVAS